MCSHSHIVGMGLYLPSGDKTIDLRKINHLSEGWDSVLKRRLESQGLRVMSWWKPHRSYFFTSSLPFTMPACSNNSRHCTVTLSPSNRCSQFFPPFPSDPIITRLHIFPLLPNQPPSRWSSSSSHFLDCLLCFSPLQPANDPSYFFVLITCLLCFWTWANCSFCLSLAQPDLSPQCVPGEWSGFTHYHSAIGENNTLTCLYLFKPITIILETVICIVSGWNVCMWVSTVIKMVNSLPPKLTAEFSPGQRRTRKSPPKPSHFHAIYLCLPSVVHCRLQAMLGKRNFFHNQWANMKEHPCNTGNVVNISFVDLYNHSPKEQSRPASLFNVSR